MEEYVRAVIYAEEAGEQYQPREFERVRGLWRGLMEDPPRDGGLDWAEVVADWHGVYVHDIDMTTADILRGVRDIAEIYLEQTEYGECGTCGRAAWLGTVGDCSECD